MRNRFRYESINRTICDVLEEMRKAYETRNFSFILGHIEEAQTMANKMEAALTDKKDLQWYAEEKKKILEELKKLDKELEDKKTELGKKDDDDDDDWLPGPV